jgi:hypothetical protein
MVWQANSVQDVREPARWLGQQVNLRLGAHLQARWLDQQGITCFAATTY